MKALHRHWNRRGPRREVAICLNCDLPECFGADHPSCPLRMDRTMRRMQRQAEELERAALAAGRVA